MKAVTKRAQLLMLLAGLVVAGTGLVIFKSASASGDATFTLSPSSGTYSSGATINLDVSETSSAGDNTNAVQVNLSFPASLQWQSTTITGPFTLCAQNTHTATTVSIACAATTAQTGTQPIATVAFKVVGTGSATVSMTSGSDIDNTSGSSVFSGTLPSAVYTLPAPPAPTPTPTPTAAPVKSSGGSKTPTPTPSKSATPAPTVAPARKSTSPATSPSPGAESVVRGSLSVTVTDSSGTRLTGAKVKLDDQTGKTNSSGVSNFAGVYAGSHSLTISAAGMQTLTAEVTVAGGENKLMTYKLTKAINWIPIALTVLGVIIGLGAVSWAARLWRQAAGPVTNLSSNMNPGPMVGAPPVAPPPAPVTEFKPAPPAAPSSTPPAPSSPTSSQPEPPDTGPVISGHNTRFK